MDWRSNANRDDVASHARPSPRPRELEGRTIALPLHMAVEGGFD